MKNASLEKYFSKRPKPSTETSSNPFNSNENNNKRTREEIEISEDEIVGDPSCVNQLVITRLAYERKYEEDGKTRGTAFRLAEKMESFEFVFVAHLMLNLLKKTHDLSQALQLKNQNIGSVVRLIEDVKYDIKKYRDDGWEELMEEVTIFCYQNEIHMPNMEDVIPGRVRRTIDDEPQTYLHRFRVDIFNQVVDLLLSEMNERFTKTNSELLMCIACLDPRNSFQNFDRERLLQMGALYSEDFSGSDIGQLKIQLDRYISNVKGNEYSGLRDIGELAKKMVEMKYHITYELVYRLVELALVLPVATATVERSFSAMKFIKSNLRNKMDDIFLTDALLCYVEKDIFESVENEAILQRFQAMGPRRLQLPANVTSKRK